MKPLQNYVNYNWRRASFQYTRAIDKRLQAQSSHRREEFAWEKRVKYFESKLLPAIDVEKHIRECDNALAVRLAVEDNCRSRVGDA